MEKWMKTRVVSMSSYGVTTDQERLNIFLRDSQDKQLQKSEKCTSKS